MLADMVYDGQVLSWNGYKYKASSGLTDGFLADTRYPKYQCVPDKGPIPEGEYKVLLDDKGMATDDGSGKCNLNSGFGFQTIPRGENAGNCEFYWAQWGYNRVRLVAADIMTRNACPSPRDGFYLHDSAKGYTHGCIEVEQFFFTTLRAYAKAFKRHSLVLKVKYVKDRQTYGGTRVE
jgi:hypothetical protein